jgi:hypothetical protein
MQKYVQTPTNLYCTFCKSVGHDKYSKKETLRSITLQEEETSILAVDSEDEDEEEVWAEAEDISSVTTACNQDT